MEIWRIGPGDIGGKGGGVKYFYDKFLTEEGKREWNEKFNPHILRIPDSSVLRTGLFKEFVEKRHLLDVIDIDDDEEVKRRFLEAEITGSLRDRLKAFLEKKTYPLAVRSSALNEDAQSHPFAGLFKTILLPNNHPDFKVRFRQLEQAVKIVYASTYMTNPKQYMATHGLSIENELMAVLIQEVVGFRHGRWFYPHLAGVAQSLNYFPVGYLKPQDGIVLLVMGLGKGAVDGNCVMRFSPSYPNIRPQMQQAKDALQSCQKEIYVLDMGKNDVEINDEMDTLAVIPLQEVADDEVIPFFASTYSISEGVFYPGLRKGGISILTFDSVANSEIFPFSEMIKWLLKRNENLWKVPIDLEFAVNLEFSPRGAKAIFYMLQVRPLVVQRYGSEVKIPDEMDTSKLMIRATVAMGNGVIGNTKYVVYIPMVKLEPARSRSIAQKIANISQKLREEGKGFILVVPGRLGSTNPYLGIPVAFSNIDGARAIVEVSGGDLRVEPSQGTHFFSNIVSGRIMYLFVDNENKSSFFNKEWFDQQLNAGGDEDVKLIETKEPLRIAVDGKTMKGIIYMD